MTMRTVRTQFTHVANALAIIFFFLFGALNSANAQGSTEDILNAVACVQTEIDPKARTAKTLGDHRDGHGVVIDSSGLVLTIGYMILEARSIRVTGPDGIDLPASLVAYDSETGFGLIRTQKPIPVRPMRLGNSAQLNTGAGVIVAGHGGKRNTLRAAVVSRRDFAGYWEYLLPDAIFTQPPFRIFGGAALIDHTGRLVGIGSLIVGDAKQGAGVNPGNMFIPINALKPILGALIASGRSENPARPWIGVYTEELRQRIFVTRLASDGPGAAAGVAVGDIVVSIGGEAITGITDFYQKLWALGAPGIDVPLTVLRQTGSLDTLVLRSRDRYDWYRFGQGN